MKRVAFGKTGLEVSQVGFGGAPIGYLDTEQGQVDRVLNGLLDSGVNLIDTAACYPGSEEAIGRAVSHRRDEYILVSKCGHSVGGVRGAEWSRKLILQTVDRALRRLRTDRIDVLLLHSCEMGVLEEGEAMGALVEAREAGKIRFPGYSGDNEEAAYASGLPDVTVIETSVSICDQANIDTVLSRARERDLGVIAKRPIANSAWKDPDRQPGLYRGYASTYTGRLRKMVLTPAALGFDGEPDQVWPEIALRFTLSQPGVHTAIIGTTNPDHARANLAAAARGRLPDEVVDTLRSAFRRAESESRSAWRGET